MVAPSRQCWCAGTMKTVKNVGISRSIRPLSVSLFLAVVLASVQGCSCFRASTQRVFQHGDDSSLLRRINSFKNLREMKHSPKQFYSMSKLDDEDKSDEVTSLKSPTTISNDANSNTAANKDNAPARGGLSRTLVLALPLMLKFVIVLIIKFMTDLVVFPLLLLYRFARLTKRRVLRLFGIKSHGEGKHSLDGITPNGASPDSSSQDVAP
jgi:hypothetical protein